MIDFGALPPEINSGRMYVGPGSGPMLAAAAAWDDLAAELQSTAASYGSTVEGLAVGPWTGPSSIAMAAAVTPYVSWISATGAQAEQAGAQAKIAAAAYETAFAATVPPPVIAANRALLMTLIATNILGQNTPAIAATEAQYMEMWAQDAAAMYAYAGSSAAASQLVPFTEPPQTTNNAAGPMQAAAVAQSSALSGTNAATQLSPVTTMGTGALHNLTTAATASSSSGLLPPVPPFITTNLAYLNTSLGTIDGVYSPFFGWSSLGGGPFLSFGQTFAYAQNGQAFTAYMAGPKAISGALAPLLGGGTLYSATSFGSGSVTGAMGKAALVGSMSVPQGWTEAAPALKTLASVFPDVAAAPTASLAGESGVFGQMALSSLAGRAVAAGATYSASGAGAAGSLGGVVANAEAATATIIVIPALED